MTTISGYRGSRLPGADWDWEDWDDAPIYTDVELRREARGDRVEALGDPDYEQPDYGLKTVDGQIHIVVKATDELADMQ